MKEYILDGCRFSTLEEFYDEVSRVLIPNVRWGRNLDAFDDILRGGFGTPEEGFQIRWVNVRLSRDRLGYTETARQLKLRLERCHPSNRADVSQDLRRAEQREGRTVFDWLVEIIRDHGEGGDENEDQVALILVD